MDQIHGWAIGEWNTHFDMVHTEDGGETWEEIYSSLDKLMDFHFTDLLYGWAVGEDGLILYTDDGGNTWYEQFNGPAHSLRSISFIDDQNAWVVGDYGTILHTDNGGIVGTNKFEAPGSQFNVRCYPNPITNQTTIEFYLPDDGLISLSVYDITGKQLETICQKEFQKGNHKFKWNAKDLIGGLYFLKLEANGIKETKKLLIIN